MEKEKTDKTRRRTRARELALEAAYMADQRPDMTAAELKLYIDKSEQEDEVRHYAWRLVDGIIREKKNLDAAIQKIALNWDISRMPIIDRNILRMASFEIICCADIPRKVAINEAIDIAKKYSTADSGAFVNGILDKITPQGE